MREVYVDKIYHTYAQPKMKEASEQSTMTSVSARGTILSKTVAVENFHERNYQRRSVCNHACY